mgnify:CR=1 FL=1
MHGTIDLAGDSHLRAARDTQDAFFDRVYWTPASASAARLGLAEPLSHAVVYDSVVHGSWISLRDRTVDREGQPSKTGERVWTAAYVRERQAWILHHLQRLRREVDGDVLFDDDVAVVGHGTDPSPVVRGVPAGPGWARMAAAAR